MISLHQGKDIYLEMKNWHTFFGLAAMIDQSPMTMAVLKPYLENIGACKLFGPRIYS